jgi:hypothetical protein
VSIRGCPTRSDTGAHHERRRLEQKHGKFGEACRRFLIRAICEICGKKPERRKPQISQMAQMTTSEPPGCFSRAIKTAFGRRGFGMIRGERPRLHQALVIRVPSCSFVVPSLVRVRGLEADQGDNGPKDQGTESVLIRVHPWLPPREAIRKRITMALPWNRGPGSSERPATASSSCDPRSAAAGGIATCQQVGGTRR